MIELLAPAGSLEKMKMALDYGADAVYVGGAEFSLRARAGIFGIAELEQAALLARKRAKRLYVAINIFAHNSDIDNMARFLARLGLIGIDGLIVSDLGVYQLVQELTPEIAVHVSTQANITNWKSAVFWQQLPGIKRLILARELQQQQIAEIRKKTNVQLEIFVHGAMCMSYSGRCLISNFMANRDANRGDCAQSCRWRYHLVEDKRFDEAYPIEEDARGSYFFNSKDLNLLQAIPDLIRLGLNSMKIEGRMKSLYYIATVTRAYRQAIDLFVNMQAQGSYSQELFLEKTKSLEQDLVCVSHRHYTTGFFYDYAKSQAQNQHSSTYIRQADFLGLVETSDGKKTSVQVRGKFRRGETILVMRRNKNEDFSQTLTLISDEHGLPLAHTKPNTQVWIEFMQPVSSGDILHRMR